MNGKPAISCPKSRVRTEFVRVSVMAEEFVQGIIAVFACDSPNWYLTG